MELKIGQRLKVPYQDKVLSVEVISPHQFGYNKPSIGVNFSMQEKYTGLSSTTLTQWSKGAKKREPDLFIDDVTMPKIEHLRLPKSKNLYPVYSTPIYSNNPDSDEPYRVEKVIEISDFIDLCFTAICEEEINRSTKREIKKFLQWFTVTGFYAQVFVYIKGSFNKADNEQLQQWLASRIANKENRKSYASLIVELRENPAFYSNLTYLNLFGKLASQMRKEWKTVAGEDAIARNHIPEAIALEAIGFVERTVVELYTGDLREAHILAIEVARKKFKLPPVRIIDESLIYQDYPTLKLSKKDVNNIIELIEGGFSVKEIAEAYEVTESTVRYHLQRRSQKIGEYNPLDKAS